MTEYISKGLEETKSIAAKIIATNAKVIGLKGDLGSGKTAVTKCIAEVLGIEETVTSPTYVIMKKYRPSPAFRRGDGGEVIHIDAYRLESAKELEVLNFKEVLNNKNNLVIIEWPERVEEILPKDILIVQCEFIDETTRKYSF
jgi:tRNA threonylcarbamoyladenosine biosynthesis protein TsaE